ncbi:polymeric immunoglobulin receptor-like isoform X2 [Toxotes jaculatrix]|uniref:polymeric immunoglobulin receptor-like isoform X2 n=1 Tax=Toxotes jaculatrix TaxID=941984 RepID=UPI001B3A96F4|nr:polymeric immunoglobulin receptor-like isoform X2 [Toxotes jaculatrix]
MAIHLRILLILTGLTGICSVTTVHKVSVKAGGSIIIPCLYASQYVNHVKYLCKGYYWNSCSNTVQTNQVRSSGKYSINDDKTQRIFRVTIKDLTHEDTDYWCIVEIIGGPDDGQYFRLSVTTGTATLYVDNQEIIGFKGDQITITCYCSNCRQVQWCRLGGSCVSGPNGSIDGTKVTISEKASGAFNVTMNGLMTKSSGWYLCVKDDLQMPVHVTVTEKPTTTTTLATSTLSSTPKDTHVLEERSRTSTDLKSLIIPLSLLIFIVMMTLLIWYMLKKHKQSNAGPSHMTTRSHAESDVDVTYSSVVTIKQKPGRKAKAQDNDVTYSTLAQLNQNI